MEIFNYADWRADGRRQAFATGNPDLDTERLYLGLHQGRVEWQITVNYSVKLKTTSFTVEVATIPFKKFSDQFFSMLEVSEEV